MNGLKTADNNSTLLEHTLTACSLKKYKIKTHLWDNVREVRNLFVCFLPCDTNISSIGGELIINHNVNVVVSQ